MYDGRIGRWLSMDPEGQYASPYLGMGNNPVTTSDPTGGEDGPNDYYRNDITGKTEWFNGSGDIKGYTHLGGEDYTFLMRPLAEVQIRGERIGIGQPGLVGSIMPVYGSVRSSIDYYQNGRWAMGTFQAAMAVSDLFLVKSLATAGVKLGAGLIGNLTKKAVGPTVDFVAGVEAKSFGKVVGEGTVHVRPTVDAIEAGTLRPRNIRGYLNREGHALLDGKPASYWQEYHTLEFGGKSPLRILRGGQGEYFLSPDHYRACLNFSGNKY